MQTSSSAIAERPHCKTG